MTDNPMNFFNRKPSPPRRELTPCMAEDIRTLAKFVSFHDDAIQYAMRIYANDMIELASLLLRDIDTPEN